MSPAGPDTAPSARLVGDLERLAREQEILIVTENWPALDASTARASSLTHGLAELCSHPDFPGSSPALQQRARTLVEDLQRCLGRLDAAAKQVRAERDGLDQLRATAHAVLPRYHKADDSSLAGARLTGAA
jgi:hypothetical protein